MSNVKDENGKFYFGWKVVIMGFILMIFGYACIVSVSGVFTLPVTQDLGLEIGDWVVWMTICSLAQIVVLLIVQKLMTEKYIRPLMIIGCICGAIGMIGFSQATTNAQFYGFSVLLGVCMALVASTPCSVLASNWFGPKMRGLALSLIFGGTSLGCMAIMPVLNQIVLKISWHAAYIVIAVCLIVVCIPLILLFAKWSPEKMGIQKKGEIEGGEVVVAEEDKKGIPFSVGIKKVSTWLMFLSGALLVIASVNVLLHTTAFLTLSGFSPTFSANTTSVAIGLLFFGSMAIGAICDRGKLQLAVVLTTILFALAFAAQLLIPSLGMGGVALLIIGYGFGCPAVNVISPILVNHMFGDKDTGRYLSYVNMFISLGGAFGATIIGMILNATAGSYTLPFLTCIIFIILCGLIRTVVTSKKFKYQDGKTL